MKKSEGISIPELIVRFIVTTCGIIVGFFIADFLREKFGSSCCDDEDDCECGCDCCCGDEDFE